jgi:hypothetical protein
MAYAFVRLNAVLLNVGMTVAVAPAVCAGTVSSVNLEPAWGAAIHHATVKSAGMMAVVEVAVFVRRMLRVSSESAWAHVRPVVSESNAAPMAVVALAECARTGPVARQTACVRQIASRIA